MNVSRLKEILDILATKEDEFGVGNSLQRLNDRLAELATNPQNTDYQRQFAENLSVAANASAALRSAIDVHHAALIKEIGADKFFLHDFVSDINQSMRDNPLSPTVIQSRLSEFKAYREQYVQHVKQMRDNLTAFGVNSSSLEPGQAEIGITLPRNLFDNKFDQLIKELKAIEHIVRGFSEVVTGGAEEIEVRQISTSDPLFCFGLSPETILAIAGAVTWALHTWKRLEEIRKLRAETLKLFTEQEAGEMFEKKIKKSIDEAIEQKISELFKRDSTPGREKELQNHLHWALESLLAYIERGVIIEVRFLPPPIVEDEAAITQEEKKSRNVYMSLKEVAKLLTFPKVEGEPILKLSKPPAER